jgi:DNA-binding response OmpR family regulator
MSLKLAHVGHDAELMRTRSLVLCDAGFSVDEAYTLEGALELTEFVHALVICHTLPERSRAQLIAAAREIRGLMPIICVQLQPSEAAPDGCIAAENAPLSILEAVVSTMKTGQA